MGAGRAARAAAVLVAVAGALTGCSQTSASDRAKDGAQAAARTLLGAEPAESCGALTAATQRTIRKLAENGGRSCPRALAAFEVAYGLNATVAKPETAKASVTGSRARVAVEGLGRELTAVRSGDGWRVSLTGLPGVRPDVRAAEACERYFGRSDALPLPALTASAVAAQLERQARSIATLRRALRRLPAGGPPRTGLAALSALLASRGLALRHAADRVRSGGALYVGQRQGVYEDELLRAALDAARTGTRVNCPADVTRSPAVRRFVARVQPACRATSRTLDRLDRRAPAQSLAEVRDRVDETNAALRRFEHRIAHAGTLPKPLRSAQSGAVSTLRELGAGLERLRTLDGIRTAPQRAAHLEAVGGRGDAALDRIGANCAVGGSARSVSSGTVRTD